MPKERIELSTHGYHVSAALPLSYSGLERDYIHRLVGRRTTAMLVESPLNSKLLRDQVIRSSAESGMTTDREFLR